VRRAFIRFARWLRQEYVFPIRVPVYLYPSRTILNRDGAHVSATFLGPFDRGEEPYIRVATGDYADLKKSSVATTRLLPALTRSHTNLCTTSSGWEQAKLANVALFVALKALWIATRRR
jgi:hypothetical protein